MAEENCELTESRRNLADGPRNATNTRRRRGDETDQRIVAFGAARAPRRTANGMASHHSETNRKVVGITVIHSAMCH